MLAQCVMSSVHVPFPRECPASACEHAVMNTKVANINRCFIRIFMADLVYGVFALLCVFFNTGVFYRPPGDFFTIAISNYHFRKLFYKPGAMPDATVPKMPFDPCGGPPPLRLPFIVARAPTRLGPPTPSKICEYIFQSPVAEAERW